MQVSIIIPSRRREHSLYRLLHSFIKQTPVSMEWNVVVVGDRQSCWTPEFVGMQFHWLSFYTCTAGGPASARNLGAMQSTADWLIFVDDDCVLPPQWLQHWENVFNSVPKDVVQIGGPGRPLSKPAQYSAFWYLVESGFLTKPVRLNDRIECIPTLNAAIRRDVFQKIGGFDSSFKFAGGEDSDLTYRLYQHGKVEYSDSTYLYHDHDRSFLNILEMYFRYGRGVAHHIKIRNRPFQEGMFIAGNPFKIFLLLPLVVRSGWQLSKGILCKNYLQISIVLICAVGQSLAYQIGGAYEMIRRKVIG